MVTQSIPVGASMLFPSLTWRVKFEMGTKAGCTLFEETFLKMPVCSMVGTGLSTLEENLNIFIIKLEGRILNGYTSTQLMKFIFFSFLYYQRGKTMVDVGGLCFIPWSNFPALYRSLRKKKTRYNSKQKFPRHVGHEKWFMFIFTRIISLDLFRRSNEVYYK